MIRSILPIAKGNEIRLSELLGAFSHALDLTEGQPPGHCIRCCWIGMHVARELGVTDDDAWDLYYTLLLKDLGCSSNAARVCELYLADDHVMKRGFKHLDGNLAQVFRFIVSHAGADASTITRFRTVADLLRNGKGYVREFIDTRCHRGADIARQMHFSEGVADGILNLDEHWDGGGLPLGLKGKAIPRNAGIALLAQVVDVFQTTGGAEAARNEIRRRSGTWFDPEVAAAFDRVAQSPDFWRGLARDDLDTVILDLEPAHEARPVDDDLLDDIAKAFAQVVDAKSPYTHDHSTRVAEIADLVAADLGLDPEGRRWLRRAALLHDLGKLGVSNAILDKPGKPTPEEWEAIKRHPAHTETILSRIGAFADMAEVAANHHERLDGKGYPKGLKAAEISLATRIITVADIYEALTSDRPYRRPMSQAEALAIMAAETGTGIDPDCFAALRRVLDPVGAHEPERDRLLARVS